ncbi:hypothetical protein LPB140_06780 [Sphingorhabdus lutea]|uniref:MPN domain-containing protein n=1 Tax=Sphingorhabdus lutea TaxID=1913578 RepID=A0A1L3JF38_9SPHN|nr:hypothetical protein LPB140_06780 [Sphingorhabdus lutea]
MNKSASHNGQGHRQRLRTRLLENGGNALQDYELIEYLLALAIPRRDTKALAKSLLYDFGGLTGLLTANSDKLMAYQGMGETSTAALKIVQAAALRLLKEPLKTRPVLASWQSVLDYLRADMAHLEVERVRILYLNTKNMLIRDEMTGDGSIDQAAIYTREVIRKAIELSAAAIIIVHNHPSGDFSPSKQDINITKDIIIAGQKLGIAVHDHIIISSKGHFSMKSAGLI